MKIVNLTVQFVPRIKGYFCPKTIVEKALCNNRIDYRYSQFIRAIYNKAQMIVETLSKSNPTPIKLEVKQADSMSPKLIIAALEVFKELEWEKRG